MIAKKFFLQGEVARRALGDSGVVTDEDFPMMEGDDVSGGGVVHVLSMQFLNGRIIDEVELNGLEVREVGRREDKVPLNELIVDPANPR